MVARSPPRGEGLVRASSETASVGAVVGRVRAGDADADDATEASAASDRSSRNAVRRRLPTALHQQKIERRIDEAESTVEGQCASVVGTGVDDDLCHATRATPPKGVDDQGGSESATCMGRVDSDTLEIAPLPGAARDREPGEVGSRCVVTGGRHYAEPRSRRRIESGKKIEPVEALIGTEGSPIDVDTRSDPGHAESIGGDRNAGQFAQSFEIMRQKAQHRDDFESALGIAFRFGVGDGRGTEDIGRMRSVQVEHLPDGACG